ncbi:copper resistance CopC family protein [Micromonospora sp. ZYX-F-536]|uniref:copper resistance CopC family protein n=1 Tax=Micromonospora sp. ZYX-F-536 TaxID=3457629 RepID=UPI004040C547
MTSTTTTEPSTRLTWHQLGGWLILAIVVSVVTLAVVAEPAALRVVSSYPADRVVLDRPPASATVSLDGMLRPAEYHLSVGPAAGGGLVSTTAAHLDGQSLVVPLRIVEPGNYRMVYHVRLEDGRQLSGSSTFSVTTAGDPSAASPPVPAAPSDAHAHQLHDDPLTVVLIVADLLLIVVLAAVFLLRRRPRGV